MPMLPRLAFLSALLFATAARGQTAPEPATDDNAPVPPLIQKIRAELGPKLTDDSKPQPGVPQGDFIQGSFKDSKVYPGTDHPFKVYIPAQYDPDKPACLLVLLNGIKPDQKCVFDNLIAKGDMPVTIAVSAGFGAVWKVPGKTIDRWNRSFEMDAMNDLFSRYVLDELLPYIEQLKTKDGRPIRISPNAADHAVMGGSTGGIGAFTLAWERPDFFSRVYSFIGTVVAMRGGNEYPALIRKTEPKALRVFIEDGSKDAYDPLFGSWFENNQEMVSAMEFAGYDVQHAWGTHGHDGQPGYVIMPDVMRWLWAGWPAPIAAGVSKNDMLTSILVPGQGWQPVADGYQAASGLASDPQGNVCFSDAPATTIYKIGPDGKPAPYVQRSPAIGGEAFGPDGTLYGAAPAEKKIYAFDPSGPAREVADGIAGHSLAVTSDKSTYVTEPGADDAQPSNLWLIKPTGEKSVIDRGLLGASGVVLSPDHFLLLCAEDATKWIYSYVNAPDGTLQNKQRFYWLHMTDLEGNSGAQDMAMDTQGTLYVATRMGVQFCDRNGRVRAILPLPTPCGPLESLCWGGPAFDVLYVTDGHKIWSRKFQVPGYSQWAAPIALKPNSAG